MMNNTIVRNMWSGYKDYRINIYKKSASCWFCLYTLGNIKPTTQLVLLIKYVNVRAKFDTEIYPHRCRLFVTLLLILERAIMANEHIAVVCVTV